jgi:anti-sigma-K factor RskA
MLPGHAMAATMYWHKAKAEAYVSVKKLPPPPEGMQYQIWAIADGKPVNIGMLDTEVAAAGGMQKVPMPVPAGEAFAISLEKAGGSEAPTPDKIYLMGKMPA